MAAFDYLLAVAMLTAVPDNTSLNKPVTLPAGVRLAIQTVAVDWEIMDRREVQYMLIRPEEYAADRAVAVPARKPVRCSPIKRHLPLPHQRPD